MNYSNEYQPNLVSINYSKDEEILKYGRNARSNQPVNYPIDGPGSFLFNM